VRDWLVGPAIEIVDRRLRNSRDFRISLRPRRARPHARDDFVVLSTALAHPAGPHGRPQIHRSAGREAVRHHADDRVRLAAQRYRSPKRGRVGVEEARPQLMAQNRRGRAVRPIFVGRELAADRGRDAKYAEECRGHALLLHVLRVRAHDHVHARRTESAGGRGQLGRGDAALQHLPDAARLPVPDVAPREARDNHREALGLRVRQRS
jgi:hypothetical protein